MVFVFDLDDTICDTDKYSEYYINKFIKEHNLPVNQITTVSRFAEGKFDWTEEEALKWYKQYGDDMLLLFPIKGNAVNVINRLYDLGHKIVIATARTTDWHTNPEPLTLQWLKKIGLKYHNIYMGRQDKEKVCEMENADIFVDDDIKIISNVNNFFKSNNKGKVFLSSTPYNQTLDIPNNITTIHNFDELLKHLNIKLPNYQPKDL